MTYRSKPNREIALSEAIPVRKESLESYIDFERQVGEEVRIQGAVAKTYISLKTGKKVTVIDANGEEVFLIE